MRIVEKISLVCDFFLLVLFCIYGLTFILLIYPIFKDFSEKKLIKIEGKRTTLSLKNGIWITLHTITLNSFKNFRGDCKDNGQ